ncbi:hypothetical protein C8J57DRAFT_1013490, partial [Mycena rebaudengoi]
TPPTTPTTTAPPMSAAPPPGTNPVTALATAGLNITPPTTPARARPSFEFSDDVPMWLRENMRVLSSVDLGCHFDSLLQALVRLEDKFGYSNNPRVGVSSTGRPQEVQAWIRVGRGLKAKRIYEPAITDVVDYAARWTRWWGSLQPEWREKRDGVWCIGGEYGDDWDSLWYPGQNGCLSVVASLYFWGFA